MQHSKVEGKLRSVRALPNTDTPTAVGSWSVIKIGCINDDALHGDSRIQERLVKPLSELSSGHTLRSIPADRVLRELRAVIFAIIDGCWLTAIVG